MLKWNIGNSCEGYFAKNIRTEKDKFKYAEGNEYGGEFLNWKKSNKAVNILFQSKEGRLISCSEDGSINILIHSFN